MTTSKKKSFRVQFMLEGVEHYFCEKLPAVIVRFLVKTNNLIKSSSSDFFDIH